MLTTGLVGAINLVIKGMVTVAWLKWACWLSGMNFITGKLGHTSRIYYEKKVIEFIYIVIIVNRELIEKLTVVEIIDEVIEWIIKRLYYFF